MTSPVSGYLEGLSLLPWPEALDLYERYWKESEAARLEGDTETQIVKYELAEGVLSFRLQQGSPPDKEAALMLATLEERHWPEADNDMIPDRPDIL